MRQVFVSFMILFLVSGCGKNHKTQYFGVEDEAIFAPREFGQTIAVIEQAKKDARSDYQYRKIADAMEKGRIAAETYWECKDEEAKAILAQARESAMMAEMYHPQPPPPVAAGAFATVDPPTAPETIVPDPPFAGARTDSPEMVIDTVRFPHDSASLEQLDPDRTDPRIKGMSPKAHYEIAGHADASGDPAYNQRLSERRAGALQQYLKAKGVPAKQMVPVGYGAGSPIGANDTDEGKSLNRRAEIRVTPPAFSPAPTVAYDTLPPGTTVEVVRFSFGSNKINPVFRNSLDQMAAKLKTDRKCRLVVAGYADSTGTDNANRRISAERARIVAAYLARKGLPKSRLMVRGYGDADPFASNQTAEGRALNRRVEIKIAR